MSNNLMLNFQAKHLYVMLLIEFKTFDHCIAQRHKIFSFPRARLSFYCGNKSCNINHFSLFNFKKYLWSKYLLAFYQVLIRNIISLRAAHFLRYFKVILSIRRPPLICTHYFRFITIKQFLGAFFSILVFFVMLSSSSQWMLKSFWLDCKKKYGSAGEKEWNKRNH